MMDKIKKFIDDELVDFADSFGHYIVIGISIICMIMGIGVRSENHIVSTIMSIVYGLIIVAGLFLLVHTVISKISRKSKLLWPLTTSIVMLLLACFFLWQNNIKASNELCIVAIIAFEIYSLYMIISSCFSEKTRINRIIAFSVIFIGLGYYAIHLTYDAKAVSNNIFDSLITIFSAIIGGGITLIGVGLTIKHQESLGRKQKEEEALKKCPYITFVGIDTLKADESIWVHKKLTSNSLVLNRGKNAPDAKDIHESNVFLRFKFKCNLENQLKNITYKSITIYSKFDENTTDNTNCFTFDSEYEDYNYINVSIAQDSIYQNCVHLIFGSETTDKKGHPRVINKEKRNDMLYSMIDSFGEKHVFFNINYVATNMDNVSYSGTIKFYCDVIKKNEMEYICDNYSNISNWIETKPYILKDDNK